MPVHRLASDADDIELIDMANLATADTGVPGFIYISSAQGSHGPRVKWYPRAPQGRNDPCLSVSIEAQPRAFNLNLPPRTADGGSDAAKRWVALNHADLLNYWKNGHSWTLRDVVAFVDALRKLPSI